MAKRRVHLTFPEQLVQEPVIYKLGKDYDIVTNIRRANVEESFGWVILEMEGPDDKLEEGLTYVRDLGIEVNEISGDVIEG